MPGRSVATAAASALLAACGSQQEAQPTAAAAVLQPCAEFNGVRSGLTPGQCLLRSSGQTLRVTYANVAAGMETGATSVTIDIASGTRMT